MREFKVEKSEDGIRLNRYLRKLLPNMKDSVRHKLLRKNYFKVNGVKATGDEVLKTGDRINIYLGDETFEKFAKQIEQKIVKSVSVDKNDILYEDENVIIYNKAAGILSQGDKSNEQSVNTILNNYLRKKDSGKSALLFKPSVVNRLDRNTSGIIIFAKTNVAAREISNAIRNGELEKHYKAVVNGNVESEQGELVNLLKKDEGKNIVFIKEYNNVEEPGYSAVRLKYKVISRDKGTTTLDINLLTGKSHQIRAQLSYFGHPIICDKKYMDTDLYNMNVEQFKKKTQELTCYKIAFPKFENEILKNISNKKFELRG